MFFGNSIFNATALVTLLLAPATSGANLGHQESSITVDQEFFFEENFEAEVVQGALRRSLQQACVPASNPSAVWVCGTPGTPNTRCRESTADCDSLANYSCQCNGNLSTCGYCRLQTSNGIVCQKTSSSTTFTDVNEQLMSCSCSDSGNGQAVQQCRAVTPNSTPVADSPPPLTPFLPPPTFSGTDFPADTNTDTQTSIVVQGTVNSGGLTSTSIGGLGQTNGGSTSTNGSPNNVVQGTVVQGTVTSGGAGSTNTGGMGQTTVGSTINNVQPTNVIQGTVVQGTVTSGGVGSTNSGGTPPSPAPFPSGGIAGATIIAGTPTNSFGERPPFANTVPRPAATNQGATGQTSSGKSSKASKRNARFSRVSELP